MKLHGVKKIYYLLTALIYEVYNCIRVPNQAFGYLKSQ